MPYLPHVKIVARGHIGTISNPLETWSCGLNFSPRLGGMNAEDLNIMAHDAFEDWASFIGDSANAKVALTVGLDEVKVYEIKADGHSEEAIGVSDQTPVQAVHSGNHHPWQVTNVVTLVADGRPPGRFGRIYLPPQCFTMNHLEGKIGDSDFNVIFPRVVQLLDDLSNLPGTDLGWGLVVASRVGSGSLRPVTQIRMGHVPDTQRRRRRSLEEAYSVAPFTP